MYVVRRVFFAVALSVMLQGGDSHASYHFGDVGVGAVHHNVETINYQPQHDRRLYKNVGYTDNLADLKGLDVYDEQVVGVEGKDDHADDEDEGDADSEEDDNEYSDSQEDVGNGSIDMPSIKAVPAGDTAADQDEDLEEEKNTKFGKAWRHRRTAHPVIEIADEHDGENSHLPVYHTFDALYKNAFYCAGSNDVQGLTAVLRELASLDQDHGFVLEELRTKDDDNLLLYAVKNDAIDTVRLLLYMGSDVNATNSKTGVTPLEVAISNGKADMINVITEMHVELSVDKEEDDDNVISEQNSTAK